MTWYFSCRWTKENSERKRIASTLSISAKLSPWYKVYQDITEETKHIRWKGCVYRCGHSTMFDAIQVFMKIRFGYIQNFGTAALKVSKFYIRHSCAMQIVPTITGRGKVVTMLHRHMQTWSNVRFWYIFNQRSIFVKTLTVLSNTWLNLWRSFPGFNRSSTIWNQWVFNYNKKRNMSRWTLSKIFSRFVSVLSWFGNRQNSQLGVAVTLRLENQFFKWRSSHMLTAL